MSFPRTLLSAMLLLSMACPLRAYAGPAGQDDVRAQVSKLVDQAEAAGAKGNKQAAYDAYVAAWALQKSYDIAGNAGSLALKLGKLPEAARYLSYSVQSFPPTGDPAQLAVLKGRQAKALQGVGRVRVHLSVPGAALTLDGTTVAPEETGADLFVSPGTHALVATADGYVEARATVEATAGSSQDIVMELKVPVALARRPRIEVWGSGLALTGVSALIGGILMGVAESQKSGTNGERVALQKFGSCPAAPIAMQCNDLRDTLSSASVEYNAAASLFIVAGAAAAGTGIYALVTGTRTSTAAAVQPPVRVAPAVGRTGGAIFINGSF
jgi:PEGA domain